MNLFKLQSIIQIMDLQTMSEDDFETCICCGELTKVRKDTPVEARACYVEGAGQLRGECYLKIYGSLFSQSFLNEKNISPEFVEF